MRMITIAALAAFSLNADAVEYRPDVDVAFEVIQMHDTTSWEKACETSEGVCDVPEGTYDVKLLDRNWRELVKLSDVSIQDSSSESTGGTNGIDGDSAYAIAVANGFDGAETEWLESLQGLAGSDGIDGMDAQLSTYSLGETGPAGGFVFYVTDDGLHGYEAAPEDQGIAAWGCAGTELTGAKGQRIGSGKHNTDHIVSECDETETAADLADAYSHSGYNDWNLPSKDALNEMYVKLHVMGLGGFFDTNYWSSSELDFTDGLYQSFFHGGQTYTLKSFLLSVRAVRAF